MTHDLRTGFSVFWILSVLVSCQTAAADEKGLTPAERAKPAFTKADQDQDGVLSVEEYIRNRGPQKIVRRDFQLFDLDHNGRLTVEEFSAIPTVLPPDQRGPLPDPMEAVVDSIAAKLDAALDKWDREPDRTYDANGFAVALTQAFRNLNVKFDPAVADQNRDEKISRAEARRYLEILLGVRRADGKPIRRPNGQLIYNRLFDYADTSQDDRLSREEFAARVFGGQGWAAEFDKADTDGNGTLSYDEWAALGSRALLDPIQEFRQLDTNLDAKLDRDELVKGTPGWKQPLPEYMFPGFDIDGDGTLSLAEYRMTPLGNFVLGWRSSLKDANDDRSLSLSEFQFGKDQFPLLRMLYYFRLDTNTDGLLQQSEFPFEIRMPEVFYSLSEDGSEWKQLFKLEQFKRCGSPSVSADGKRLAFDAWPLQPPSESGLYVVDLAGGEPRFLGSGMMPNWFPDGRMVVASRSAPQYGIWIMDVEGDRHQFVTPGWGGQVSPDGRLIAYADGATLKVYDVESGESRTVLENNQHPYRQFYWNSCWSPDSRRLCLKAMTREEKQEVAIVNMVGEDPGLKVYQSGKTAVFADFAWHPAGNRIVFPMNCAERECMQLYEFDPSREDPPRLVKGQDERQHMNGLCWTPDGKYLIITSRQK